VILPIASVFDVAAGVGYPLIFLFVFLETGCGIPFAPGDLALVSGAIAAADGKLQIGWVIVVAAGGAIVGDNVGYVIGRLGGRKLLERPGLFAKQRNAVLVMADPYFERHGPKTVFIGRWLPVLRVYASWLAGASRMQWSTFLFWNASGGIFWACAVGVGAYFGGSAAKGVISSLGKFGVLFVVIVAVSIFLFFRRQQHRAADRVRTESQQLRALDQAGTTRPAAAEPQA
jgi:membrane protein DedA with SNARE-associated domain